jgi:hypothetical protein
MRKTLAIVLPVILALTAFDASAQYIPYKNQAVQAITPDQYDQNKDSYITADEVEMELREDAINKAIIKQKFGGTKEEAEQIIKDMEDSIEYDAEVIINILDKDGDELVEPEEMK